MSIYVDELRSWPQKANTTQGDKYFGSGKHSCHMTCDGDLEDLHRFALSIGLRRAWFQDKSTPHYDLTPSKRVAAVRSGAREVSTLDAIRIWRSSQSKEAAK